MTGGIPRSLPESGRAEPRRERAAGGRMAPRQGRRSSISRRVVLEQERIGDREAVEHPDDVAVLQARGARRPCPDASGAAPIRSSTISYLVNVARSTLDVQKRPITAPPGFSSRTICLASAGTDALSRKSKQSQQRMPSTVPSPCRKRVARLGASSSVVPACACRSMSEMRSSMNSLHPRRSPRNSTLLPTTGPKSSRSGDVWFESAARNFGSALDATAGSAAPRAGAAGRTVSGSVGPLASPFQKIAEHGAQPDSGK